MLINVLDKSTCPFYWRLSWFIATVLKHASGMVTFIKNVKHALKKGNLLAWINLLPNVCTVS